MAAHDPAWERFRDVLAELMEATSVSASALASTLTARSADLWVSEDQVANWRRGRATPPLALLQPIVHALNAASRTTTPAIDPLALVKAMGILAEPPEVAELVDRAYRLQKLELKLAEAQERAAASGRRRGAADIVQAGQATGEWAVAVWPAVEGPADCRMHVADRIDLQRCDRAPIDEQAVWAVPELKAALRAAYAVRGSRGPRWAEDSRSTTSQWSIPYIGGPTGPLVASRHPEISSVAFSSLTIDSWVNDVASLTALAVGYGLTTTRDLAMEVTGLPRADTSDEDRRLIHERLLASPPVRRMWSHHSGLGDPPQRILSPRDADADPELVHVRLRESDELLVQAGEDREASDEQVRRWFDERTLVDEELAALPDAGRLLLIDVGPRPDIAGRWLQVLLHVEEVLTVLVERGLLPADMREVQSRVALHSPAVGAPLLAWLAERRCPAVVVPTEPWVRRGPAHGSV